MQSAYSVAQIRAAEAAVVARVPAGSLMARAAHALAVQASTMLGFTYGAKVILLVGGGDNGGDALYAGAEIARRGGQVRAVLASPASTHADALDDFRAAGGKAVDAAELRPDIAVDLIIDGMVGIGASGPLRPPLLPLVAWANRCHAPVLAVDLPSGVDPDTGAVIGPAISAEVTLCFGGLKVGVLVGPGRWHSGCIRLIDIGISGELGYPVLRALDPVDVRELLPRPRPEDDKYSRGVVGVVAGSGEYPGAAQLAVGSARLGGVGAVRYAGHAASEVSRQWSDVLVTETVSGAGRVQAWAIGPGLGNTESARQALRQVLLAGVPVLVDADGLNLLAGEVTLRELMARRTAPTVLTPHDREFARLFGEIGADRVGAARRAAAEVGAVILLKGFATIVAEPGGECYVNPTGSPVLATAGSGDVLSGLIGSLLATGLEPLQAAALGAYLHGAAGALAAERGPVTAPDLLAALRAVIADAA
ncbi:MAG: ADP-dependent NAD(P)H-hydrate dehydratase / NAD(P)H-hydrate epimerase [Pseudonocardiales bacterium]|nr:ADP-dependent NAD(P)H-hydrate dehydratase / NAD(P)H-hydrate epimerase [Pseudonocardiales bacterium]